MARALQDVGLSKGPRHNMTPHPVSRGHRVHGRASLQNACAICHTTTYVRLWLAREAAGHALQNVSCARRGAWRDAAARQGAIVAVTSAHAPDRKTPASHCVLRKQILLAAGLYTGSTAPGVRHFDRRNHDYWSCGIRMPAWPGLNSTTSCFYATCLFSSLAAPP